jgi:cardiolipin synthase
MGGVAVDWLMLLLWLVLGVWAAGHVLIYKRDPRSALGWVLLSLFVPVAGPFFYWVLGINRVQTRARGWQESGRRLQLTREGDGGSESDNAVLAAGVGHLADLRLLGDRVVGCPLVAGNGIVALINGEECYPAMLAAIDGARRSINLSSYIFDGGGVGRDFTEALRRASERGVAVRVIIDALGEKYSRPPARALLEGSAVKVARFLPLRQGGHLNLRNHRKLLVVDGTTAFTGGMNIGERHLLSSLSWRRPVADMHFRVTGPVVTDMQRAFMEDWHFVTGKLLEPEENLLPQATAGTVLARAIADGPDREFRLLHAVIMGALSSARSRILIMTPYFIPDRAFLAAMTTAALRGVDVALVLPSCNNLPLVHWASRAYLWEILQQGVRVFYQPPPFVHTKLLVVDDLWSLVGSANMDPRSLRLNFEFNLELYDRALAARLAEHVIDAMAKGKEVTLADMDGRPLWERLRDGAAKLFSPYL